MLSAEARIVVSPELSLTGYELDADPVALDTPALATVVDACAATGALALVGAPVREAGRDHLAILQVDGEGVRVAYRKSWLGGAEVDRFLPGDGPAVMEVDGWRRPARGRYRRAGGGCVPRRAGAPAGGTA